MNHPQHVILMSLILSLCATFAPAQEKEDSGIELKPREQWTTVFGGQSLKLHFDVNSADAGKQTAVWSYAAGERRLASGELSIAAGADGGRTIELPLRIPPVRAGVIFETKLTVSVVQNGEVVASVTKPITVFADDPFADRKTWRKELAISLYDPEGQTADRFEKQEIPFHRLGTIASVGNAAEGIVVIGEGLSLKNQRGLFDVLTEVAGRGVPVLCLASTDGTFPLPFAADEDLPQPDRVLLDRNTVIRRFDKRFDTVAWGTTGNPAVSALQITRSRTGIDADVTGEAAGWPWLEMTYGERGVLIWCGFGLIERWEDSPTPRYLLVRLFEELNHPEPQTVPDDKPRSLP